MPTTFYSLKINKIKYLNKRWLKNISAKEKRELWYFIAPLSVTAFSGLFFGAAHLFYGSTWEIGKVPSASIAGILLGLIYFKQGFPAAVMLHWAFNFFPSAYVYFSCTLNTSIMMCEQVVESNILVSSLEILLLFTGFFSIGMILLNFKMKKYSIDSNEI